MPASSKILAKRGKNGAKEEELRESLIFEAWEVFMYVYVLHYSRGRVNLT